MWKIFFRKGEIRWVSIGINIGREIDGKGNDFARPCLLLHVIGYGLSLVAPLTSKNKNIPGYLELEWSDNKEIHKDMICISQIRIISQNRILGRISKISDNKLLNVKNKIKEFFNF